MLKTKKQLYIWIGVALVGLALCVGLILVLCRPAPEPEETTAAPTTTVETLPPPAPNVFTPADFAYNGDYLTCLAGQSVLGIDVSTHQKEIDWQQVKDAGVEFVMIRIGYRGSKEGMLYEDEWAQTYYEGAKSAGLKVGGYFFSQSITPEEAVQEAKYALDVIKGWRLEMPLVFDWEIVHEDSRTNVVDARMLTDCAIAFCETVKSEGYYPMIYFNPNQSRKNLYLEELTDYDFWLAMYAEEMTYEYKVDMWQYTCTGSVPGINGNVDINLYFPYDEH